MKVAVIDGVPWRVRSRNKLVMTFIPLHTETGRQMLLRDAGSVGGSGQDRWGYTDDIPGSRKVTWYRETSPDVFARISGPRALFQAWADWEKSERKLR